MSTNLFSLNPNGNGSVEKIRSGDFKISIFFASEMNRKGNFLLIGFTSLFSPSLDGEHHYSTESDPE